MKRISLFLAVLLILPLFGGALAADVLYPADVVEYGADGQKRIEKVYSLAAEDDPGLIPTADFERDGYLYALLDMTKADMTEVDSRAHIETVKVDCKSKATEDILPLLDYTLEVTTEDGYSGVLTLDEDSIEVAPSTYGTSTKEVSATRSYPNLSDADVSLIPHTTEDGGRTLELADVKWQESGGYYHAAATYTGTATNRYVTGYTATAKYSGEVAKTISDEVVYTAIFGGSPTVAENTDIYRITQDASENGSAWIVPLLTVLGAAAVGVVVLLLWRYNRRGERRYRR